MLSPIAASPTTRPSSSATQISWSRGTISVMKRRCSSSRVQFGRKRSSVSNEAMNVSATASSSSGRARRIIRVLYGACRARKNEPVRLTRIYTRGGDAGETSLGDGSRASKLDPRIRAYGIIDELNSHIGIALAGDLPPALRAPLARVQNELFDVGATSPSRTPARTTGCARPRR